MPEMTFTVRWPDGSTQSCYSPSLVMHDHLVAGEDYTVADFLTRTTTALTEASERVRAKFGMYCTSASAADARNSNARPRPSTPDRPRPGPRDEPRLVTPPAEQS